MNSNSSLLNRGTSYLAVAVEAFKEDPPGSIRKILVAAIGLFVTLFHLYANSWWGFFSAHILRITHWICLSGLTLLTF